MSRRHASMLLAVCLSFPIVCSGRTARIEVTGMVTNRVTRFMTGACLEDVNHEVYGGIYSQMLYGESFQEPAASGSFEDFDVYGGEWASSDGVLSVSADPGAKIVAKDIRLADGEASVDIRLPEQHDGYVGLVVKVNEAAPGADAFIGYEVALNPREQVLRLGRHRHNWEHISDTPCVAPLGQWLQLTVACGGRSLEASLDGKSIVRFDDTERALSAGSVGLRTFNADAEFRNLVVRQDGREVRPRLELKGTPLTVSRMWQPVQRGWAQGTYALCTDDPFTGRQSQRVTFVSGQGEIGVENQGLNRWGLYIQAGKEYEGLLWARCEQPTSVTVALESADGARVYGERVLTVGAGGWQRLAFTLTPSETDTHARLAIKLTHPGSVVLGYAFLQPGPWGRFKDLPVRKDVAEALIAQGLTVLRYGGSMVNIDTYRWKNMIGPRDLRPAYRGHWFRHSSNGWGIIDFIDFCRAAGFLSIPASNMGETPQDMADFVEYVNGPINSEWGRRRAADGHPAPYNLRYLQLGNEEAVDENYWQRFKPMAEAIWQKDPNITIVVGDFAYDRPIRDPYNFRGAPRIRSLAAHKKILDLAVNHDREIWFDVHVWTGEPRQPDGLGGVPTFIEALRNLNPRARFKVAVFELNANNHALRRALSNAHAINELKRLGDDVPVVCSANCLQPYQQNENGWDQGLLFLNPAQVWDQPPYYVTQMMSAHYQPLCLETTVECHDRCLDATATRSEDGRTLVLSVVNVDAEPVEARIQLAGFFPRTDTAKVVTLIGQLGDINTPREPRRIVPTEEVCSMKRDASGQEIVYTFKGNSFTILRFE
ncbi:MAG: DUF1080 domain-containing protein [Sedimentisphaerales bacterium]|nr:DUF1080 domain-containing protein [Sedimentisphaerales bacterium]